MNVTASARRPRIIKRRRPRLGPLGYKFTCLFITTKNNCVFSSLLSTDQPQQQRQTGAGSNEPEKGKVDKNNRQMAARND